MNNTAGRPRRNRRRKLYIMCFLGEGPELQEVWLVLDAETASRSGKALFSDFLSTHL